MDKEMKRINITISDIHIKMLKVLSRKLGLTISDVIRRAIEIYHKQNS